MTLVPAPGPDRHSHELIPLAETNRWQAALRTLDHSFWHTWASCNALIAPGDHDVFLYVYADAAARIVCPLIARCWRGSTDIATPPGFSGFAGTGRSESFPARWLDFARRQGWVCGYIGMHLF